MMKIAGTVKKELSQSLGVSTVKFLDRAFRRGETKLRAPSAGLHCRKIQNPLRPCAVEIDVDACRIMHGLQNYHTRTFYRSYDGIVNVSQPTRQNGSENPDFYCRMRNAFRIFARTSSSTLGSAWAFIVAILVIAIWALTGPMFHFSDTWQLIINTGTTIVTFLMVFLIQNTQNRDAKAVHLKLDELIRALQGARNRLVDLEKLSDEELKKLEDEFSRVQKRAEQTKDSIEEVVPRTNHAQPEHER